MKFEPEDFIVEEILPTGEILERGKPFEKPDQPVLPDQRPFTHFVLQKRLWTTANAVRELARRLHVSQKRVNYAGNKDRNAITTQRVSVFDVPKAHVLALKIKDMEILGAWNANEKVKLGEVAGNRFTLAVPAAEYPLDKMQQAAQKIDFTMPNYFGDQRFGSVRRNTHLVGKLLLQGKHKEAVMNYLCFDDERETDAAARKARAELAETGDFSKALLQFPGHLKLERSMLGHLERNPTDFLGAFRRLHRSMQLLFIHAYQSHLFNQRVRLRMEQGKLRQANIGDFVAPLDAAGMPDVSRSTEVTTEKELKKAQAELDARKAVLMGTLIGHQSRVSEEESGWLAQDGLTKQSFMIKSLPELSSKGGLRPLFVLLNDLKVSQEGEKTVLRFSLPSGSYATEALAALGVA